MGAFSVVKESTFNELQLEAGTLVKAFDPANPEIADEAIICATTGGITPTCTASYVDNGEDIDNCPNGMLEFMDVASWECSLAFTALNITAETIKLALGAADIDSTTEGVSKIVPRSGLKSDDFSDIWWVGDISGGGVAAIRLMNALSTGGFSLKTTKNGKGQLSVTLTGHYSLGAQKTVPMEFYIADVPADSSDPDGQSNTYPDDVEGA